MAGDPTIDPLGEFRAALTPQATSALWISRSVGTLVARAIRQGWTPIQLAEECSRDLGSAVKPGAVITERLRRAADHPPAHKATQIKTVDVKPWGGVCDPSGRWVLHPESLAPVRRCACMTTGVCG